MPVSKYASAEQVVDSDLARSPSMDWADALIQPGHTNFSKSMVAELAQYLQLPADVVAAACASGEKSVAEEWNAHKLHRGSETSEIVDFYRNTQSYLFDLTQFNVEYPHTAALEVIRDLARSRGLTHFLDFGAGIGSVGIFFARNGFDVSMADVSEPLQEYVRWRFGRRGLKGTLINLNKEQLPENAFGIITTFDVLEHLPRPAETMRDLARSMKIGGLIALNVEEPADRFPQHISTYEEVLSTVAAAGFRRVRYVGKTEIFERVQRSAWSTRCQVFWGKTWYGGLYRPCMDLLELLRVKELLRVLIKGPRAQE